MHPTIKTLLNAKTPVTHLITITAKDAEELFALNVEHNRTIRPHHVRTIAADIREGRWEINGSTIRISKTGKLLDGQHRLLALIQVGTKITTFITFGLEDEAFMTIDTGQASRKTGDHLKFMGVSDYYNCLASTIPRIQAYFDGSPAGQTGRLRSRMSTARIIELHNAHPEVYAAVQRMMQKSPRILSPSMASTYYYLFGLSEPEIAEDFKKMVQFGNGKDGLIVGQRPNFDTLCVRLTDNALNPAHKLVERKITTYVIKAFNAERKGITLGNLKMNANESFPEIEGIKHPWPKSPIYEETKEPKDDE